MAKKRKTPPRYKSGPNKGKFKPRRARRKRSSSSSKPKRKKRSAPVARRRRRRSAPRRRRRSSSTKKVRTGPIAAGAVIGYLQNQTNMLASLPAAVQPVNAKGKLLAGGALYLLNKHAVKHKYVGYAAEALLTIGAYEAGQAGFSIQGEVGWDSAYAVPEVSGEIPV